MAKTRVYVDDTVDVAYLSISGKAVSRSVELSEDIVLDIASDGTLCGVEILGATPQAMKALRQVSVR